MKKNEMQAKIAELEDNLARSTAINEYRDETILNLRYNLDWAKAKAKRLEDINRDLQAEIKRFTDAQDLDRLRVKLAGGSENREIQRLSGVVREKNESIISLKQDLAKLHVALSGRDASIAELKHDLSRLTEFRERESIKNEKLQTKIEELESCMVTPATETTTCEDCESKDVDLKNLRTRLSERDRFFVSVANLVDGVRWTVG